MKDDRVTQRMPKCRSGKLFVCQMQVVAFLLAVAYPYLVEARDTPVEIGALTCVLGEPSSAPRGEGSTGAGETREVLCKFQPKNGATEEYAGTVEGISISVDHTATLIWFVKQT